MKQSSTALSLLTAFCLLTGVTQAAAQQPGPSSGMMGHEGAMMGSGMGTMGMMGAGQCPMTGMMPTEGGAPAFVDGRVAFLKAELAISDAQKSVWDAYAEALRKNMQGMESMHKSMTVVREAKSPVERLDARIAIMEKRVGALKEIKPPLVKLYGALSDEQKRKADTLLTGMGCMM